MRNLILAESQLTFLENLLNKIDLRYIIRKNKALFKHF